MKWPPNKNWTATKERNGFRHFEVQQYGGKGKERWVQLFPVLNQEMRLNVSWEELKDENEWASGWLRIL